MATDYYGVLGVALGSILLPSLSKCHADNNFAEYSRLLDWGLRLTIMLTLPAALALGMIAVPLLSTFFQRGAFDAHDVLMTSYALIGYSVGLIGLILVKILAPGFYAKQGQSGMLYPADEQRVHGLDTACRIGPVDRARRLPEFHYPVLLPAQARYLPARAGLGEVLLEGGHRSGGTGDHAVVRYGQPAKLADRFGLVAYPALVRVGGGRCGGLFCRAARFGFPARGFFQAGGELMIARFETFASSPWFAMG